MTKHYCDACGELAADAVQTRQITIGERKLFRLRAIFELIEQPLQLSTSCFPSDRVSSADICGQCMADMLRALAEKLKGVRE